MRKITQVDVNQYYTNSNWVYQFFFYSYESLSMHHGFWDSTTKTVHEASLNENDFVAQQAGCSKNKRILDAGCGVGGTAIYLAKKYGYHIDGITLNPPQVIKANNYAAKKGVSDLVTFSAGDYTKTKFADNTFDCIYAIESVSHSPSKLTFAKEAYRILKPNGKLVIADGYVKRKAKNDFEKKLVLDYQEAFALPEASSETDMKKALVDAKFKEIRAINKLKEVEPSIDYIYNLAKKFEWFVLLIKPLPFGFTKAVVANYIALTLEMKAHQIGMFDYFVHVATKK